MLHGTFSAYTTRESPSCDVTNRSFHSCFEREKTRDHRETLRSRFRACDLASEQNKVVVRMFTRNFVSVVAFGVKGTCASRDVMTSLRERLCGTTKGMGTNEKEKEENKRERKRTTLFHDLVASHFRDLVFTRSFSSHSSFHLSSHN